MRALLHIPVVSTMGAFLLFSCADPIEDRQVVARLALVNICPRLKPADTVDVVMRFYDKDTTPLVDADVYRQIPPPDSVMKLGLRLKKTDLWSIKEILDKNGKPFCSGYCEDTIAICLPTKESTRFGQLHPIADTIKVSLTCTCRSPYGDYY